MFVTSSAQFLVLIQGYHLWSTYHSSTVPFSRECTVGHAGCVINSLRHLGMCFFILICLCICTYICSCKVVTRKRNIHVLYVCVQIHIHLYLCIHVYTHKHRYIYKMNVPLSGDSFPLLFIFLTLHIYFEEKRLKGSKRLQTFYGLGDCLLFHKEIVKQKNEGRNTREVDKQKWNDSPPFSFLQGLCLYPQISTFLTQSCRSTHEQRGSAPSRGAPAVRGALWCVTQQCLLLHEYPCAIETSRWRRYVKRLLSFQSQITCISESLSCLPLFSCPFLF